MSQLATSQVFVRTNLRYNLPPVCVEQPQQLSTWTFDHTDWPDNSS